MHINQWLLIIILGLAFFSCKRKEPSESAGGKGGTAVLKVTPAHHGNSIDSSTVYIKYDAQNTPSSYDDSAACVVKNGKPVAAFSELKTGRYYLLARGWDTSIADNVIGGIPFIISEEKTYDITVPVTEGD